MVGPVAHWHCVLILLLGGVEVEEAERWEVAGGEGGGGSERLPTQTGRSGRGEKKISNSRVTPDSPHSHTHHEPLMINNPWLLIRLTGRRRWDLAGALYLLILLQ